MRIYLDHCVVQYLKGDEGSVLLQKVLDDTGKNVYVFSEAHLYDLRHDLTVEKFADMKFLEKISADHCMYFEDDKVLFNQFTPRVYYGRFDWDNYLGDDVYNSPMFGMLTHFWKLIPLNFSAMIPTGSLPPDMPDEMRGLLSTGVTMYDFFVAFTGMSRTLTIEQKRFRALLQYLHQHDFLSPVYASLGIEGFNGKQITDRERFFETFSAWCEKLTTIKNPYNRFLTRYNCLEMLGFVKGKPKKQKMMNMINDGRHAFFGSYCDVVISRDEDFLNKSSFIYTAMGISTLVLSIEEFSEWLGQHRRIDWSLSDIVNFLKQHRGDNVFEQHEVNGMLYTSYWLPECYFNYWNMLTIGKDASDVFFYLSTVSGRCSNGQFLIAEIDMLIALLSAEFGGDLQEKGAVIESEIIDGVWPGRSWCHQGFIIELLINEGLHLTFNLYNPEQ